MGIEPFLVGSSLDCVLAQRLARRLCEWCKEAYVATEAELDAARWPIEQLPLPEKLWRPAGCRSCSGTGYRGRLALHEVMPVTHEEIERLAVQHASANDIERRGPRAGHDVAAIRRALQGRRRADVDRRGAPGLGLNGAQVVRRAQLRRAYLPMFVRDETPTAPPRGVDDYPTATEETPVQPLQAIPHIPDAERAPAHALHPALEQHGADRRAQHPGRGAGAALGRSPGPLDEMLTEMVNAGGSDLHMTTGIAPTIRLHGRLMQHRRACGR